MPRVRAHVKRVTAERQWDAAKPEPPHQFVIDVHREETITGLRHLPRRDGLPSGRVRASGVYLSAMPFKGLLLAQAARGGTSDSRAVRDRVIFAH